MNLPFITQDWSKCVDNTSAQQVATLSCIGVVLNNIINVMLVGSAFVALVLIIYSGIKYTTSQGDQQKIESARKTLTWAIIGIVFLVLSFAILQFIRNITGTDF